MISAATAKFCPCGVKTAVDSILNNETVYDGYVPIKLYLQNQIWPTGSYFANPFTET